MGYIIGVDGGGTGCRVAVANAAGKVLGRAEGGAANIATDPVAARSNILATVEQALENAGTGRDAMAGSTALLGLAGANLGDYRARLLPTLPFARAEIVTDAETTLVGALGEADGCIGAIGTGSVFGRRQNGVFSQIGGWGFLLGDDGSGARLGRDLLHFSLLAHDGLMPHSSLTKEIMTEFQGSPSEMVEQAKGFTPGDFGRFAPRIVAAAKAGDDHAETILATHTDRVRQSLDAAGFDPAHAFCMLGGLGQVYLARLPARYRAAARPPLGNALDGALAMARRL